MILPTSHEMLSLDKSAIEHFGIPGMVLMENAGLSTVLMMEQYLGPAENSFAMLFIGPGNNGGDGFVIGRHLHQRGCLPVFFLLVPAESLQGDAAKNFKIVQSLNLPIHFVTDHSPSKDTITACFHEQSVSGRRCYAFVDSIFGIGLTRKVSGHFADIIQFLNQREFGQHVPMVAVDCPSGLNVNTGMPENICIRADYTATYGFAKPGHFMNAGKDCCGTLTTLDIGIPHETTRLLNIHCSLISQSDRSHVIRSLRRPADSHKGSNGHLLILAGSPGKTGAAILSVRGALRSGCGLVSLVAPEQINLAYESTIIEAMTIPVPGSIITWEHIETVLAHCATKNALVIGPGLGISEEADQLVCYLYQNLELPVVIDADAITILSRHPDILQNAKGPRIFTPHPGELGRLLTCSIGEIQSDRLEAARKAMKMLGDKNDNILLLKGAGTVVVDKKLNTCINSSGNPGMAAGGMGDVLSGIIGSLLCQGLSPLDAACTAAYLHGLAADELNEMKGIGFTATEVAEQLPITMSRLRKI